MKSFVISLFALIGLAGCHKDLNPGRCNSTSDCPSGQTCDLSPSANGTCVCNSPSCMDGGAGTGGGGSGTGGGGASGGTGGAAVDGGKDSVDAAHLCQSATDCAAPTPECGPNGACVQCTAASVAQDCTDMTRPICDMGTNTCVPCTSDQQCVGRNGADPGVCMSHLDGHCATQTETIFVTNNPPSCTPAGTIIAQGDAGKGTANVPLCSMDQVPQLVTSSPNRDLVVVRGAAQGGTWTYSGAQALSIVGQSSGAIAGGASPGFRMSSGTVYVRDLELTASNSTAVAIAGGVLTLNNVTLDKADNGIDCSAGTLAVQNSTIKGTSVIGINATGGSLNLNKVTIDSCAGGGVLLNGTAFDIENTTVTNNGPGMDGAINWGGILVTTPPSSGPTKLNLVTIQNNNGGGVTCSGSVDAMDALVTGNTNTPAQVSAACGFTSCGTASSSCGAQP